MNRGYLSEACVPRYTSACSERFDGNSASVLQHLLTHIRPAFTWDVLVIVRTVVTLLLRATSVSTPVENDSQGAHLTASSRNDYSARAEMMRSIRMVRWPVVVLYNSLRIFTC